jgi:hypothetical protein
MKMERYSTKKIIKFVQILVITNNNLPSTLIQIFSMIKAYYALAISIILYGCEIWTLGKEDKKLLK